MKTYNRICSLCNKVWPFPENHVLGYETEEEKNNWLCGDCFFDNATPTDIAREVFGFEDQQAEAIGELASERIAKVNKKQAEINRLRDENIFGWTTKHKIGWPAFLILVLVSIWHIRKYTKKLKEKKSSNLREEVQDKFNLWRLNMYLSVAVYFFSFFILKGAIDKWLRPNIHGWLKSDENTTVAIVTGLLGVLFLVDGYISSELKTPLQRLSIKIENADISEKEKKSLLSKTQQSNETFKETLKRFGLLTIAGMTIKLLGEVFDNNKFALICYAVPLGFGLLRIYQVSRKIKKIKK